MGTMRPPCMRQLLKKRQKTYSEIWGKPTQSDHHDSDDNDERPILTQARLNALCFPLLQDLAARLILSNLDLFAAQTHGPASTRTLCENPTTQLIMLELLETMNSQYKQVSETMLFDIEVKDHFKKIFSAFRLLVGPKCLAMDLDWLMVYCPSSAKGPSCRKNAEKLIKLEEALRILATQAPNLQKLKNIKISKSDDDCRSDDPPALKSRSSNLSKHLLAMKDLTILQVDYLLLPDVFVAFGENLPKLQFLECIPGYRKGALGELYKAISSMTGNMKSLRRFKFTSMMEEDANGNLYFRYELKSHLFKFCLENFPQLEMEINEKSQLKVLTVSPSPQFMGRIVRLSLSYTYLVDSPSMDGLLHFAKLRELSVCCSLSRGQWRLLLQTYGPHLVKLQAYGRCVKHPDLRDLVTLCPRLEYLHMTDGTDEFERPVAVGPDLIAHSLTSLRLGPCCPWLMSTIFLMAPNLQKANLYDADDFKEAELLHFCSLVRSNLICNHLVSLKVELWSKPYLNNSRAVFQLIKDACAFAPLLTKLSFPPPCDKPFTVKLPEDGCLDKCLDMMDEFFYKSPPQVLKQQ